jgi:hypothetical protein
MFEIKEGVPHIGGRRFSFCVESLTFYQFHESRLWYTCGRNVLFVDLPVSVPANRYFRFRGFNLFEYGSRVCVFTADRALYTDNFKLAEDGIWIDGVLHDHNLVSEALSPPRKLGRTSHWALFQTGYLDLQDLYDNYLIQFSKYDCLSQRDKLAEVSNNVITYREERPHRNMYFMEVDRVPVFCLLRRHGCGHLLVNRILSLL